MAKTTATVRDLVQARANTNAALTALKAFIESGRAAGVTLAFLTAFLAELETTRNHMDALEEQSKALQDHVLKAFEWGSDAAWSLADELGLDAGGIARAARSQVDKGVFSAAERTQLVSALNDVLDARDGVRADGWNPAPMPFDSEGRCSDPSCLSCRTSQATA
ncbi:hypothetical protein ACWCOT_02825 [Nonomuraea bangladeshensis]